MEALEIDVNREGAARYKRVMVLITTTIIGWILMKLGLCEAIDAWADSLHYRLEDKRLIISSKFVFRKLKIYSSELSIPLDKITDIKRVQGPILGYLDMEALYVQTAGAGYCLPEAILYPLNPEQAREQILRTIDGGLEQAPRSQPEDDAPEEDYFII